MYVNNRKIAVVISVVERKVVRTFGRKTEKFLYKAEFTGGKKPKVKISEELGELMAWAHAEQDKLEAAIAKLSGKAPAPAV